MKKVLVISLVISLFAGSCKKQSYPDYNELLKNNKWQLTQFSHCQRRGHYE